MAQGKLLNYLQSLKRNIPIVKEPEFVKQKQTQVKLEAFNRTDVYDSIVKLKELTKQNIMPKELKDNKAKFKF